MKDKISSVATGIIIKSYVGVSMVLSAKTVINEKKKDRVKIAKTIDIKQLDELPQ